MTAQLLQPFNHAVGKGERYYQQIAINRTVEAILKGQRRVLVTMATGTGKTAVAFQMCWKLWSSRWNRTGEHRRPRILYLADRNILVDQPKDGIFAAFGDARYKIESGEVVKSREIYFAHLSGAGRGRAARRAIQAVRARTSSTSSSSMSATAAAPGTRAPGASILEYFEPAYQLGMTATPLRDDNRDTYRYFGNPIYTYSLRQGIEDGFLAPYRVHRVITEWDAAGWRPSKDELDRYGREIPDDEYQTKDFERVVALRARTRGHRPAPHRLHEEDGPLRQDDRLLRGPGARQRDAAGARTTSTATWSTQYPDYVCRVTADEGGHRPRAPEPLPGRGHQDADDPDHVAAADHRRRCADLQEHRAGPRHRLHDRVQADHRPRHAGARRLRQALVQHPGLHRLRDAACSPTPTSTASRRGSPKTPIDGQARAYRRTSRAPGEDGEEPTEWPKAAVSSAASGTNRPSQVLLRRRPGGRSLRIWSTSWTRRASSCGRSGTRTMPARKCGPRARRRTELRERWANLTKRGELIAALEERGISFADLAEQIEQPEADPFDLLCHLAFNAPLRTRRERAQRLRSERKDLFEQYGPEARQVLDELLEKYAEHGDAQFALPDVLQVPPISTHGAPAEIIRIFGGADQLRDAVNELQSELYAA